MGAQSKRHIIQLGNKGFHPWKSLEESFVRGFAWNRKQLLKEEEIYRDCLEAIHGNCLSSYLSTLDGNFAAIIVSNEKMYLIADNIRSYPILFSVQGEICFVSDEEEKLAEHIQDKQFDKLAVAEFLSKGYLSKGRTLFSDIYLVEAGEYIEIDHTGFKRNTYYEYLYPSFNGETPEIIEKAFTAIEQSFSAMLKVLEGRQIVIPLSGGYDSRMIACLCKKKGLSNVVCFTYGKAGTWDTCTSEEVAKRLGYKWFFVEYTDQRMVDFFRSKEYMEYQIYAGNLDTTPHTQDLLAIRTLLDQQLIEKDSIVIPGHSGDFLGGSHLPSMASKTPLYKAIYDKYYNLNSLNKKYRSLLCEDLKAAVGGVSAKRFPELFMNQFTNWGVKSRQASFIVNSVRIYDFYGLDWRLPLWNKKFVECWLSIPWSQKQGMTLYNQVLFVRYFDEYGVSIPKELIPHSQIRKAYRTVSAYAPFLSAFKKCWIDRRKKEDGYNYLPLLNKYSKEKWLKEYLCASSLSVNAAFAIEYIQYCRTLLVSKQANKT